MSGPSPIDITTRNPRRWWILLVLIVALFGISVDNTILIIALPTLARDLQASAADLQWMVDSYILVFAGFLLLSGALADRYGRRLMLVIGLVLFGAGSVFAPFVTSADQLIALRAFMGLGASFMMPATLSIIADVFDADERPKAIAAWGSISAIGIVAGPLLGGWLLDHFSWPSVFLINVPFADPGHHRDDGGRARVAGARPGVPGRRRRRPLGGRTRGPGLRHHRDPRARPRRSLGARRVRHRARDHRHVHRLGTPRTGADARHRAVP